MKKLSLVYFGAPSFSGRLLEKLINDRGLQQSMEIKLVLTTPDKLVGRQQILTPSPVKIIGQKYQLPIFNFFPQKTDNYRLLTTLLFELKIDAGIVYGYGERIPASILQTATIGFFNLHPSLLPRLRGSSPIPYSIFTTFNDVSGETGITLIKMDKKIDHGPIIFQEKLTILPTDKKTNLEIKLTDLGFSLIKKFVQLIATDGQLPFQKQNHQQATYTRLLKKEDGHIPLSLIKKALKGETLHFTELPPLLQEYLDKYPGEKPAGPEQSWSALFTVYNLFRGLSPWPGLWTIISINGQKKRLKITDVGVKNLSLIIKKVQLEGKKEVDFDTFQRAYQVV